MNSHALSPSQALCIRRAHHLTLPSQNYLVIISLGTSEALPWPSGSNVHGKMLVIQNTLRISLFLPSGVPLPVCVHCILYVYVHGYMCICRCSYIFTCICRCVCIWRSDVNLRGHSSGAIYLEFLCLLITRSSLLRLSWLACPRDGPIALPLQHWGCSVC